MRIGVDVDGVIHDFVGAYRDLLARRYNKPVEDMPTPTRWGFYEDWGISAETFADHLRSFPDIVFNGDVIAGARESLIELRGQGHTIHLVTHRSPEAQIQTQRWLQRHQIPYDTLTFAEDKTIADVDVFLEDSLDNYAALRRAEIPCYLLAQPWNGGGSPPDTVRVTWPKFMREIEVMETLLQLAVDERRARHFDLTNGNGNGSANPKDLIGLTKPPMHLLPPSALLYMSKVMELGATKYGPYNWRSSDVRWTVYLAAAMRHLLRALDGEDADPESGMPPEAHVMSCMAILLDAKANGNLIDDRPMPGAAVRVMEELTDG